tara:strand:+ start:167 stop:409 length:243 start_codon:yes stop_codon:yes gene_type:complete
MSLEELNKMSQKTPSQDSPSDPEWDLEELKKAIVDSAEEYDRLLDKAGQHELPKGTAEAMWEMERHLWAQREGKYDESSF